MRRLNLLVLAPLLLGALACDRQAPSPGEAAGVVEVPAEAGPKSEGAAGGVLLEPLEPLEPAKAPEEATGEALPAASAEASAEVFEPTAEAPEPAPHVAQRLGTLDNPIPATAPWAQLPGLDEVAGFEFIPLGVLVECFRDGGDYCELSEDGKLQASKFRGLGLEETLGSWPDNAWRLKTEQDLLLRGDKSLYEEVLVAKRWDGERFTKLAEHKFHYDSEVIEDAFYDRLARASWSGGLVVFDPETGRVFNQAAPDTTLATLSAADVWAVTQAASGKLIVFEIGADEWDETYLQVRAPCLDATCQERRSGDSFAANDPRLDFSLILDVSRGGDAMSFELSAKRESLLVHYDPPPAEGAAEHRDWRSESLPKGGYEGLWGDASGGLWLSPKQGELRYRSPSGEWLRVSPPPGYVFESFAMRAKPRELLAYVTNAKQEEAVFAVRGPVVPESAEASVAKEVGAGEGEASAAGAAAGGAVEGEAGEGEATAGEVSAPEAAAGQATDDAKTKAPTAPASKRPPAPEPKKP